MKIYENVRRWQVGTYRAAFRTVISRGSLGARGSSRTGRTALSLLSALSSRTLRWWRWSMGSLAPLDELVETDIWLRSHTDGWVNSRELQTQYQTSWGKKQLFDLLFNVVMTKPLFEWMTKQSIIIIIIQSYDYMIIWMNDQKILLLLSSNNNYCGLVKSQPCFPLSPI